MTNIEILYARHDGQQVSTRCQGWDEDEAFRQLEIMLADLTLDRNRVLAVVRLDEAEPGPYSVN